MRSHQLDFVDVNGLCCHESSIKCVFVQLTQTLFPLQINLEAPLPESSFLENKKIKMGGMEGYWWQLKKNGSLGI